MRSFIGGSAIVTAGMALAAAMGCGSKTSTTSGSDAGPHAAMTGGGKMSVMESQGQRVLRLSAPADATCTGAEGSLQLKSGDRYVEFWLVRGAKTIDEGVARLDPTIAAEFKDFKPQSTTIMTVAGSPATRLIGPGSEADDGDPGKADIVVFQIGGAGGRVFVACTHDENLKPAAEEWMIELLRTAQQP